MPTPPTITISPPAADFDAAAERRALIASDDILPHWIKYLDSSSLAAAMSFSTSFNKLAGPLFYHTVVFDYSKSFCKSAGSYVLEKENRDAVTEMPGALAPYSKAHHLSQNAVVLEIVNPPNAVTNGHGGIRIDLPREWKNNRVWRLRQLCPRLVVVGMTGDIDQLRRAQALIHGERPAMAWSVYELLPTWFEPQVDAISVMNNDVFLYAEDIECRVRIDMARLGESPERMHQMLSNLLIMRDYQEVRTPPGIRSRDYRQHIDIVYPASRPPLLTDLAEQFAALFLRVAFILNITIYLEEEVPENAREVEEGLDALRKMVQDKSELYDEVKHKSRLEKSTLEVTHVSTLQRYASPPDPPNRESDGGRISNSREGRGPMEIWRRVYAFA